MTAIRLRGEPWGTNGYRDIIIACNMLEERHPGLVISKMQRLLLMERGTVEGLLSVLQGNTIDVKVVMQQEDGSTRKMVTELRGQEASLTLLKATTTIFTDSIPSDILSELEDRRFGIGEILGRYNIETRREITEIGYDPRSSRFFRTYDIYANGKVWFTIHESFDQSLYS